MVNMPIGLAAVYLSIKDLRRIAKNSRSMSSIPHRSSCEEEGMRTICWPIVTTTLLVRLAQAQDRHSYYMDLCERAKSTGDFASMEEAIQQALRYGRGDEYAWRSLAWAQARQGKWRASLKNAVENIERNGATGWSLAEFQGGLDTRLSGDSGQTDSSRVAKAENPPEKEGSSGGWPESSATGLVFRTSPVQPDVAGCLHPAARCLHPAAL
jgi:hypothetical protein